MLIAAQLAALRYDRENVHDGGDVMGLHMVTLATARERVHESDMVAFRRRQQAVCQYCSAEWGDMGKESVPEHDYGYDDANVCARAQVVILIASGHVNCCSTVRTSEIEGRWQSAGDPESGSGSVNADGHARDCGHGRWQMLAEHRMKPFYAQQQVWASYEARATSSNPRMYIFTAVYSQSPFSPS